MATTSDARTRATFSTELAKALTTEILSKEWEPLTMGDRADVLKYLTRLLEVESLAETGDGLSSSANTTGPVTRPSGLSTGTPAVLVVSLADGQVLQTVIVSDSFKSTGLPIEIRLAVENSYSTQGLTLRWPTPSGETRAGDPGHVPQPESSSEGEGR